MLLYILMNLKMNKEQIRIREQLKLSLVKYDNYLKVAKHTVLCVCKDCQKVKIVRE
jgi:hypothetical protein